MSARLVVAGGINADIRARPAAGALRRGTSNPSHITITPGGVARNVAAVAASHGAGVDLLGVVGDDALSAEVLELTSRGGVNVDHVLRLPHSAPSTYVSIVDEEGRLELAASDMKATDAFDKAAVGRLAAVLSGAGALVVDTNLTVEAIKALVALANDAGVPVVVDPVSVAKAEKLAAVSGRVFVVKPNKMEEKVIHRQSADVRGPVYDYIVTSLGAEGVKLLACEDGSTRKFAARTVAANDETGAGDAFVAGLATGVAGGRDIDSCVREGMAWAEEWLDAKR